MNTNRGNEKWSHPSHVRVFIIKCNMQKSVLTGNYEFYYAAGLIAKLSGVEISDDIKPIELGVLLHQEIERQSRR